ncbi:MAG: chemotaxis protein CheW [Candidatus Accumulibacter sp.]|uniref:chemotaxis protein CheW n=1 Tax=Accumulibacter sp. TaxID=2053492 RepID=UPI0019DA99A2|nr:chemotaxis protein CheW [Accumulibacter sp.]MBE2258584.1 chemotaxis protein CheW [Paracoccaceae bacterium]MCB1941078.1 chemotaxis protein CheW [Accumulibacter sp.]MCP5248214.1 chemotaxis protein CheW [Accumulibacter sp.]
MTKKISLHDFQSYLAARLAGTGDQTAAGLLGIQAGSEYWLLDLADSGEIVPLTPLTTVPLTRPWFAGIANIRGNLYSAVDFSAFLGKEPTPQNASSRLLLIGTRHGSNAALLVTRMIGLRNVEALNAEPSDPAAPAWAHESYSDNEGRRWKKLKVRELLADETFMDIGV